MSKPLKKEVQPQATLSEQFLARLLTLHDPLTVYLSSKYSRRKELQGCRDELQALGTPGRIVVTSGWLDVPYELDEGGLPVIQTAEEALETYATTTTAHRRAIEREEFAGDGFREVRNCKLFIALTDPPDTGNSHGARDTEIGMALAFFKPVVIVGYLSIRYHALKDIMLVPEGWPLVLAKLAAAVDLDAQKRQAQPREQEGQKEA